jgi:hypothetical protein
MTGDMCSRGNDDWLLESEFECSRAKTYPKIWRLQLADSDERKWVVFDELWQVVICANNGITQLLGMPLLWQSYQARNLKVAFLFDDIDTGTGVSTCSQKNNRGLFQLLNETRQELLGMLISRSESDLASARSIRGADSKGVSA